MLGLPRARTHATRKCLEVHKVGHRTSNELHAEDSWSLELPAQAERIRTSCNYSKEVRLHAVINPLVYRRTGETVHTELFPPTHQWFLKANPFTPVFNVYHTPGV